MIELNPYSNSYSNFRIGGSPAGPPEDYPPKPVSGDGGGGGQRIATQTPQAVGAVDSVELSTNVTSSSSSAQASTDPGSYQGNGRQLQSSGGLVDISG